MNLDTDKFVRKDIDLNEIYKCLVQIFAIWK
jgi:hypothetical protein